MSNVHRLTPAPDFDRDVDTVIYMIKPPITEPDGIAWQTLLAGPASDPEIDAPTRHPRPAVPLATFSIAVAGWVLGVVQTMLILRFLG